MENVFVVLPLGNQANIISLSNPHNLCYGFNLTPIGKKVFSLREKWQQQKKQTESDGC